MKSSVLALAFTLASMPFSFGQTPAESSATPATKHHKTHKRKSDDTATGAKKKHRKGKVSGDTSGTDASIATHSTKTAPLKQ
ncbi:MAG TPA: hypothetical protein DEQ47_18245 [Solibacterales bacterium]|nr:hypothetical protein [Bryobacterales bacterium]